MNARDELKTLRFTGKIYRNGPDTLVRLGDLADHIHEVDTFGLIAAYASLYSGFKHGRFSLYYKSDGGLVMKTGTARDVEQYLRNRRWKAFKLVSASLSDDEKDLFISMSSKIIFVSARWAAEVIKAWQKTLTPEKIFDQKVTEMIRQAKNTGQALETFDLINDDAETVLNRIRSRLLKYNVSIERGQNIFAVQITNAA